MENQNNAQTGGGNTGKTFTQEEVNQIVSGRLKEEREKMKKEQDATFAEREQKIAAREMRMNALDKLHEKGLPSSLVDAINCSSDETMNKSIDILMQAYKAEQGGHIVRYTIPWAARVRNRTRSGKLWGLLRRKE